MPPSRLAVLSLYRALLREASKFTAYPYRRYFQRRIRDGFREDRVRLATNSAADEHFEHASSQLEILKRQAIMSSLYKSPELVVERRDLVDLPQKKSDNDSSRHGDGGSNLDNNPPNR